MQNPSYNTIFPEGGGQTNLSTIAAKVVKRSQPP